MSQPLQVIEGTWEEVAALGLQFAGRRVRLTLLDTADNSDEVVIPQRPLPTPEQARLGIQPAAIGRGTYEDIMKTVQTFEQAEETNNDLLEAIEENRFQRRLRAEEKA